MPRASSHGPFCYTSRDHTASGSIGEGVFRLEFFPLKVSRLARIAARLIRRSASSSSSVAAPLVWGVLLSALTLGLSACAKDYYRFPTYTFANRPIPPSRLQNRVMVAVTEGGAGGNLQILDGLRDIRRNVQNTIQSFSISGYSGAYPSLILNFPEQLTGYVFSSTDGTLRTVNYGTESSPSVTAQFPSLSTSVAVTADGQRIYSAEETAGILFVQDNSMGRSFALNLPNVYKVAVNSGDTVALAMVRNSNSLYRILKLNSNQAYPPGAIDCQPYTLPVYCVVPVPGTYDHPLDVSFSLDGTTAYVLNCGPECGGTTASVSMLQQSPLTVYTIPTSLPYPNPVTRTIPVPGGVTTALSDGNTLYVAGQQLQPDGLFAGNLSTISLATNTVTGKYSISDGYHSKLLFADDNTLWVGSQHCGNGERAKLGLNYNCLTRFDLGAQTARIIPDVTPGGKTQVPYPNENNNAYYYGDLTGLCWVQNLHKIYTAYGGQVHAFNTADGSEIDNFLITVQGTALDVAYIDAITNSSN